MDTAYALRAIDEGICLWWRTIGSARGFARHTGDIEWVASESRKGPERIYNVRFAPEDAERRADEIAAAMRDGTLPRGMLLTKLSTPEGATELFARRGLRIDASSPCMALNLAGFAPAPAEGSIRTAVVDGAEGLRAWVGIVNRGLFGCELFTMEQYEDMYTLGNTSFHLACIGGIPASACMTVRGATATLECVATLPEYRRRGLGAAVTSRALERLKELGVDTVTLRAEPDGVNLYKKLGFIEYCKRIVVSA
jgi:ribosomal protein S18 acetylase RimI-like enzyme